MSSLNSNAAVTAKERKIGVKEVEMVFTDKGVVPYTCIECGEDFTPKGFGFFVDGTDDLFVCNKCAENVYGVYFLANVVKEYQREDYFIRYAYHTDDGYYCMNCDQTVDARGGYYAVFVTDPMEGPHLACPRCAGDGYGSQSQIFRLCQILNAAHAVEEEHRTEERTFLTAPANGLFAQNALETTIRPIPYDEYWNRTKDVRDEYQQHCDAAFAAYKAREENPFDQVELEAI